MAIELEIFRINMTESEINIAIASSLGKNIPPFELTEEYVDDPHWNSGFWEVTATFQNGDALNFSGRLSEQTNKTIMEMYAERMFPDYCRDLNAMREVEATLSDLALYRKFLYLVVLEDPSNTMNEPAFATAKQRAIAYLRTKGLIYD